LENTHYCEWIINSGLWFTLPEAGSIITSSLHTFFFKDFEFDPVLDRFWNYPYYVLLCIPLNYSLDATSGNRFSINEARNGFEIGPEDASVIGLKINEIQCLSPELNFYYD
jgi:hypothetical protein